MVRLATCCCKALGLNVEGDPVLNGICHCDDCKQRTGSAFGWSAYFNDDQIAHRHGNPGTYDVDIVPAQQRYFCLSCGTTLFWKSGSFPGLTGVAGGCFVDNPLPEPTATYRDAKRCAWVSLPKTWRRE
ncbi:MAG: GFA family protein [Pseudomonadota bacterium]